MFEFHGWIRVRIHNPGDRENLEDRYKDAFEFIEATLKDAQDGMSMFELRPLGNMLTVVVFHGLRNHEYAPALELFSAIGEKLPLCYGLMYVHDGESYTHSDAFRVLRLAHGEVTEHDDPFLSPVSLTVD